MWTLIYSFLQNTLFLGLTTIILLIKSTIYTCSQKGKIISFEGTKYKIFKNIQTLFLSSSENNTHDKFLQK